MSQPRRKGGSGPAVLAGFHVEATAKTLRTEFATLVGDLHRRICADIEPLGGDQSSRELLHTSIESNLDSFLRMLQHDIPVDVMQMPTAATEFARRMAQQGVPVQSLVRAYRLGHGTVLQRCLEVLERRVCSPELVGLAAQRLTAIGFSFVDWVTEQSLHDYETERDRWLQQRTANRAALVQELLRDGADTGRAEAVLGYQVAARAHIGLVLWTAEDDSHNVGVSGLARFAANLGERLNCSQSPLFLARDQVTAWTWLPFTDHVPPPQALACAIRGIGADITVAAGRAATNLAGFRRTHEQARLVQATMLAAAGNTGSVATFDEVGPVALFCHDLDATRTWVAETLGRLALDDDQHDRLRETLRVFLATGGSFQAAATQLALHRNSVYYRVRKAEEERGRPVAGDRLEVEIALKACRWLGRSVLTNGS